MKRTLLQCVTCLLVFSTALSTCPLNYFDGKDGNCYKLSSTPVTHDMAKKTCANDGAHLPQITSKLINDEIKKIGNVLGTILWVGLHCFDNSSCIWDSGADLDYVDWKANNPNPKNGACVVIEGSNSKKSWESVPCDEMTKYNAVCQILKTDTTSTSSVVTQMPEYICDTFDGYFDGGDGYCYKEVSSASSFVDAQKTCNNNGGNLPKITNNKTNEELKKAAINLKAQIWLGLNCLTNGTCQWYDGTVPNFSNWIDNMPDVSEGACVTMKLAGSHQGLWESTSCDFDKGVICQKTGTFTTTTLAPTSGYYCAAGFILGNNTRCYTVHSANDSADFSTAEAVCEKQGAHLAVLQNEHQNTVLQQILSVYSNGSVSAYIGLNYDVKAASYKWIDGTPFNYNNFIENLPDIGNCVQIFVSGKTASKWLNVDCATKLPYACVTKSSLKPVLTSTTVPPFTCSYEYTTFERVKTPNYPRPYPPNIECDSLLVVAAGSFVRFTFETFSLKFGDYIDIFDGPHSGYPLLYRIQAGTNVKNTSFVTATSNQMLVRFVSLSGVSDATGFMGYFQQWYSGYTGATLSPAQKMTTSSLWTIGTPPPSNPALCPMPNVFHSNGIIASPGYPQPYGVDLNCLYLLEAESHNSTISIIFGDIDIDTNFDFLNIYDGNSTTSIRLASLGGKYPSGTIAFNSSTEYLLIEFRTANAYRGTGFVASFKSITQHTINPSPTPVSDCINGWIKDDDFPYCYKYHVIGMVWEQAQETCQQSGADLVSINSVLQQLQVYKYINASQSGETPSSVYIGFHRDVANNNVWTWVDGNPVTVELWLGGEPSKNGNCGGIRMNAAFGAGWYAENCAQVLPFICYYEIKTPLSPV